MSKAVETSRAAVETSHPRENVTLYKLADIPGLSDLLVNSLIAGISVDLELQSVKRAVLITRELDLLTSNLLEHANISYQSYQPDDPTTIFRGIGPDVVIIDDISQVSSSVWAQFVLPMLSTGESSVFLIQHGDAVGCTPEQLL